MESPDQLDLEGKEGVQPGGEFAARDALPEPANPSRHVLSQRVIRGMPGRQLSNLVGDDQRRHLLGSILSEALEQHGRFSFLEEILLNRAVDVGVREASHPFLQVPQA